MDSTLDFVTRARRAWQEFRNPSDAGRLNAATEGFPANEHEAEEARLHPSLYPRITAMENQARLAEFRLLVGIVQDKSFTGHFGFQHNRRPQASLTSRSAPNMGIYTTVCDAEIKAKRNYKGASRMINFCLGLQIVVAAALTALGAADGSRSAVTVFGAINTIIAGLMSYLKGSGLPNRLKYFQHEWHKVREYIEERERDFYLGVPGLNVQDEIEKIRVMFENVRADVETNTPERFVSVTQLRASMAAAQNAHQAVTRPQPSFSTESVRKTWNEKEAEAHNAYNRAQGTAHDTYSKAQHGLFSNLSHLKEVMEDKMKDVGRMEKELEDKGKYMVDEKKRDLEKGLQTTVQEVGQVGREIEHNAQTAAQQSLQQADDAITRSTDAARAGVVQQVASRSQQVDDTIAHGSDAARATLAEQKDYLNAALMMEERERQEAREMEREKERQREHEGVPPKPT